MRAQQYLPPVAFHAEGPVWWPDDGSAMAHTLRYVDMMAGRILTARNPSAGEVDEVEVPGPVAACIRPRADGGIAVLTEHGLSISDDPAGVDWTQFAEVITDPDVRFNDGGCDPAGRFLAGTMRYDQADGGGALYQITGTGEVSVAFSGVTVSNGIAWTASGEFAYYNDTPSRSTWILDWDEDRGLTNRRRAFTLDADDPAGGPDGLCVDADDNVWTAIYGGSRVECRNRHGQLLEVVELPVTNVTACTFGGADLRTLFITTTKENVPAGTQPEAGSVYSASPGVTGTAVTPFHG